MARWTCDHSMLVRLRPTREDTPLLSTLLLMPSQNSAVARRMMAKPTSPKTTFLNNKYPRANASIATARTTHLFVGALSEGRTFHRKASSFSADTLLLPSEVSVWLSPVVEEFANGFIEMDPPDCFPDQFVGRQNRQLGDSLFTWSGDRIDANDLFDTARL